MTSLKTIREVEVACRRSIRKCRAESGRASWAIWMRTAHTLLVMVSQWRSLSADESERLSRCDAEFPMSADVRELIISQAVALKG